MWNDQRSNRANRSVWVAAAFTRRMQSVLFVAQMAVTTAGTIVFATGSSLASVTPSETPRQSFWVTDSPPYTVHVSPSEKTAYVGGYFGAVGAPTGSFAVVDGTSAELLEDIPLQRLHGGEIWAVISDGNGGWIVGGKEFGVDGASSPRRLVHILSDGALDLSLPDVSGIVHAMRLAGSTLYVVGRIDVVGEFPRANAAAINIETGQVLPWAPWVIGGLQGLPDQAIVNAIDVTESQVYLGGSFNAVNGTSRHGVAAVERFTGTTLDWNPDASGNTGVSAVHVAGGKVYIGGSFTHVGGLPQARLAAVDPATGELTSWSPALNQTVSAITSSNDTLYIGGRFTTVNGQDRSELAAFDLTTGALLDWNPSASGAEGTTPQVHALAVDGSTVYVGGHFTTIGGQQRSHLAVVDRVTGEVVSWQADAYGPYSTLIHSIAVHNGQVAAGGVFAMLGGIPRIGIAAFDVATGKARPWNPSIPGGMVLDILQDGCTVYVAGNFEIVNGVPRVDLAALDARTGELIPGFAPQVSGLYVSRLAIRGSTLYIGGYFFSVNGLPRYHAAALNAATGAVLPDWDGGVGLPICGACHVEDISLSSDGQRVYYAGPFSTAGNTSNYPNWPLRAGVAAFDAQSGALLDWAPAALPMNHSGYAVVDDGSHVWFGGEFKYFEPIPGVQYHRPHIAKLQHADGTPTFWSTWVSGGGVPSNVEVIRRRDNVVFFGGRFDALQAGWAGGPGPQNPDVRYGLAAMRASSHLVYPWAPQLNDGASDIALSENSLFAIGQFSMVGNRFRPGLAVFDFESRNIAKDRVPVDVFGDCAVCPADLDWDGNVNVSDLLMLITSWGPCPTGSCPADINQDGTVNVSDLLMLINTWGPC